MADQDVTTRTPILAARDAVKTYGPTRALTGVTLDVTPGEVRGVVGHNGAGKSTLMRMLTGIERVDSGTVTVAGATVPGKTGFPGVRMAFQETSLAGELTVAQNAYLSSSHLFPGLRWRSQAGDAITHRLQEIFPGNAIGPNDFVDDLTLAGRQMVEIARATLTDDLRVLILDEPTESLTTDATESLYAYVARLAADGTAVLLISHRLGEVLAASDTVTVLKDGAVVETLAADRLTEDDLFVAMGGEVAVVEERAPRSTRTDDEVAIRVPVGSLQGEDADIVVRRGEIVGLAGIAGQGQEEILEKIWRRSGGVSVQGQAAYVPGDRQRFGIFPLWSVAENLSVSSLGQFARFGVRDRKREAEVVDTWVSALKIRGGGAALMTSLSGGNQQKAIVARAFASDATTILLNDPFRGVDVHTKAELYALLRREADAGRSIVWYSSENSEMHHCDRAYVLRAGRIAGELAADDIDDAAIIALSFAVTKEAS